MVLILSSELFHVPLYLQSLTSVDPHFPSGLRVMVVVQEGDHKILVEYEVWVGWTCRGAMECQTVSFCMLLETSIGLFLALSLLEIELVLASS